MKQVIILVILLSTLFPYHSIAQAKVLIGDLYYYLNYNGYRKAAVTYGPTPYQNSNVEIPAHINYFGDDYEVTTISVDAFANSSVYSVIIPNSITEISQNAFAYCPITSIYIPNSLTIIGSGAFCYTNLKTITIPQSVKKMESDVFHSCTSLVSVTIEGELTKIPDYCFSGCSSLTSVYIPNGYTEIGENAFSGCSSLKFFDIPNSVITIGEGAFAGCGLANVIIPSNIVSIGKRSFNNCGNLTSIIVEAGNTIYDSRNNCNAIIETASNKLIRGCKNTIIPNSITSIGDYAFQSCSGLVNCLIPNSVTSIGDHAFESCSGLVNCLIPNSVTSIGDYAFFSLHNLTSIVVDGGNTRYDSRENCNAIIETESNKLLFGCQKTTIPNSVTCIGDYAFYGCINLVNCIIPNGVISIGKNSFDNCINLTSVVIPNSVTSIGDEAFIVTGLSSVDIPNGVTSIGKGAFQQCSNLKSVVLPSSVTLIGNNAFRGCSNLNSIKNYSITPPNIESGTFSDYSATLHVKKGYKNVYASAYYWSNFSKVIDDIEYEIPKCALPTMSFVNGKLTFNCETEGAKLHYRYSFPDGSEGIDSEATIPQTIIVSVYATKEGYEDSDVATKEINVGGSAGKKGDVNEDGTVNGTDIQEVINIIINEE